MDAVAEVKARLNIEDVIAQYVQLKRTGRNFKGISPWTNEKTASFVVSPEKQIWHDFSSGKGGDVFSFVMEMEGLDFKATLELLARQAGIDLEQFGSSRNSGGGELKTRTLEALEIATKFYQRQLVGNRVALQYLLGERKFSKQTVLTWRIGYSPNTGRGLTDYMTKKGFTTDELRRAGLSIERQRRPVDMFRGRIMIPLSDSRGAVIGFTARLLHDEPDAPKYINTPQTPVYDKSRQVFGLHLAKEAIRREGYAVVVEGNMDVISSHQAEVTNVVASAGTAMTEMHLKQIKRFTGDIRLCFDSDQAGIAATERAIPLAQKTEVSLKIINIPGAKDPDELIQKDTTSWVSAIENAVYATDWLIDRYKQQLDLKSAQGKLIFTDTLLTTIRRLRDPVEQEHYLKLIAKLTDSSAEAVAVKLISKPSEDQAVRIKKLKNQPVQINRALLEYQRLQDHLLAMVLMQPKLRKLLDDCHRFYFSSGPQRTLFDFLVKNPKFKGDPKIAEELQEVSDYTKIVVLQFEELYQDLPEPDLSEQAQNLKHRLIDRYVKLQKHELAKAMQAAKGDDKQLKSLMVKADKLNLLIKR
ncbi:DNA primase [Candidatus Saccharibacteria bacterium]|nr:DNA primase [Candidatus Saccharibacteria bacterium]